jgi:hypothetical protein
VNVRPLRSSTGIDRKLEDRPDYAEYVTPKQARTAPIYNWGVFPHSFSSGLVHGLLDEFGASEDALVYDPFVGAGTTLLACKELGVSAFGTDVLPLSTFLSNTKVQDFDTSRLRREFSSLSFGERPKRENHFADIPIIKKAYDEDTIRQISVIREAIERVQDARARALFQAGLLCIVGTASKTIKAGGWLKLRHGNEPACNDVVGLFTNQVERMIRELDEHAVKSRPGGKWQAWLADARRPVLDIHPDVVITSPPYLNKHDYTRVFVLELALGFVDDHKSLKALRYKSLRSHVEAKAQPGIPIPPDYSQPRALREALEQLSRRELNNRLTMPMVGGYFEDIYMVLRSLASRVNEGGQVAFVLGNSRFGGVMIPVDLIVAELGTQVGLDLKKIMVARHRGNSAQQMGRYGRVPARESIIVWEKSCR